MLSPVNAQATPKRRVLQGLAATALNPVATVFIQLGTVPLLLRAWGAAKYGDWILLSAIPAYLGLTNMGLGDASGSDMTLRVGAGDAEAAIETFQSSWLFVTATSFIVFALASPISWWIPWQHLLKLSSLTSQTAALILAILGLYVAIGQQNGIFESGFKCSGNFALGQLGCTFIRLVEAVVATLVGVLTGNLVLVALTYLCARVVLTVAYAALLYHKVPWLRLGIAHAQVRTIRRLAGPAFGFIALPAGQALSLQGFTLLVGGIAGPVAVTAFSTLRTLSRVNFQMLTTVMFAFWPELSRAFGAGNISLARSLHRRAYQVGVIMSIAGASALWIAGPFVYRTWIHNAVPFNRTAFHIFLLVSIANAIWYTSSVVPMSTNRHLRLTLTYLVATALSLGVAWGLTRAFGIAGGASALLIIDACMCWVVLRAALKQVHDTPMALITAVFAKYQFRRPASKSIDMEIAKS